MLQFLNSFLEQIKFENPGSIVNFLRAKPFIKKQKNKKQIKKPKYIDSPAMLLENLLKTSIKLLRSFGMNHQLTAKKEI